MLEINRCLPLLFVASLACNNRHAAWEVKPAPPAKPIARKLVAPTIAELQTEAEESWQNRGERASLERAIELWQGLVAAEDAAGLAQLSRAYFLLAESFLTPAGEKSKRLATYEKGITSAEQAMLAVSAEFSNRVNAGEALEAALPAIPVEGQAALFWYASNLGRFITADMTTAAMYKSRIETVMQRVLELDPTFFHAAPHRFMGAFRAEAPAFLGGNLKASKEHFETALQLAPDCLETKLLYAELYATRAKDSQLYNRLLTEIVAADPKAIADLVPEQRMAQDRAQALLDGAPESEAIAFDASDAKTAKEN